MKGSSLASSSRFLVCPLCEAGELKPLGQDSARCESCAGPLSGAMLEALRQIVALPDALGTHACEECAHPEMRFLPDGTFHCPACGSEVLSVKASSTSSGPGQRSEAYRCGWIDGRYAELGCFTENPNLLRLQDPSGRLDYYRSHRAALPARQPASAGPWKAPSAFPGEEVSR